jgi:hypothetical protein
MSTGRRIELLCSVGAGVYGLQLVLGAYLQPYGDSRRPDQWVMLHPGISDMALPYIIAFGLPILGIAVGGVIDATRGNVFARLLLWLSTATLAGETGLAMASIGLLLIPPLALGLCASGIAFNATKASQPAQR